MQPRERFRGFLQGLAKIMDSRKTPLPPTLTGYENPAYDPATTRWKLDIVEPGIIRIAQAEIDLLKLWGIVARSGGGEQLSQKNQWSLILPHFNLREGSLPNGQSVTDLLVQTYKDLVLPFEEMYRNNLRGHPQRQGQSASNLPDIPATSGDGDGEVGVKRKLEMEEGDSKRARFKMEDDQPSTAPTMSRSRRTRNKVEYIPLLREVDSTGGRPLKALEPELAGSRHPLRDINDWGLVSVDALTLSLRSQLPAELSYALTTVTLLSTMRGDTPTQGFPIMNCPELLDELLDLLEQRAFNGQPDTFPEPVVLATHKELVTTLVDYETEPFAGLHPRQGAKDPKLGPLPRAGAIILTITNILRNMSFIPDNCAFLQRQERLFDVVLRLCSVTRKDGEPVAVSSALSLHDLITVRKDALVVLAHLSSAMPGIMLEAMTPNAAARIAYRSFHLLASFLVDPLEAVSPFTLFQTTGSLKPPLLPDCAMEILTRLAQPDLSRKVFAQAVPATSIEQVFVSCVHRLPVMDNDYQILVRGTEWLSYLEKVLMGAYALAFIAPPSLKRKLKSDPTLGFRSVMLRMLQKTMRASNQEFRGTFAISSRRAVETMKLLDDGNDMFDTTETTVTTLSFGMGLGEGGESTFERGTGLLGGHRESAWDILMMREVYSDPALFNELESMARVE
ncbi:ARID domain-containing protein [Mycena kentingensis (nom. inval.)]|nr:ARID domain-containing protein [Mycena kentingensis (nom. inval.)]